MPALESVGLVSPIVIRYPLPVGLGGGVQETLTLFVIICLIMRLVGACSACIINQIS